MTRSPRYDYSHTLLAKTHGGVAGVSPAEGVVAYFPYRAMRTARRDKGNTARRDKGNSRAGGGVPHKSDLSRIHA